MWSVIVRRATLCVLYVLLAYCDVTVLSQKLHMYDSLYKSHGSGSFMAKSRELFHNSLRLPIMHQPSIVDSTRASDNTIYVHGVTHQERKALDMMENKGHPQGKSSASRRIENNDKQGAASELKGQYGHYRVRPGGPPHFPPWSMAETDLRLFTVSTVEPRIISPFSYIKTTLKPRLDSWRQLFTTIAPQRTTVRAVHEISLPLGKTIVQTGLRPQNPCCHNDTDGEAPMEASQKRERIRYYHSFSKERGYVPHRAMKLTNTAITQRPQSTWINRLVMKSSSRFYNTAPRFGLRQSYNVVGDTSYASERNIWTTPQPYVQTTTWVPQTTKDRIYEVQLRTNRTTAQWNVSKLFNEAPRYAHETSRLGFGDSHGREFWERGTSDPTTTKRFSIGSINGYDYYDEHEVRQNRTRVFPLGPRMNTNTSNVSWSLYESERPQSESNVQETMDEIWNRNLLKQATTTQTPTHRKYTYPLGPKTNDEDDDFKKWKFSVEQTVQRLQRPSGRRRTSSYQALSRVSPILEHNISPLIKVSGVEEQDWKYVHETNQDELLSHRKPRGSWRRGEVELNSVTLNSSIDELRFFRSRHTTTTTTSTIPSAPLYQATSTISGPLVSITRPYVPRKHASTQFRRPTSRSYYGSNGIAVIKPRYRHHVYYTPTATTGIASDTLVSDPRAVETIATEQSVSIGSLTTKRMAHPIAGPDPHIRTYTTTPSTLSPSTTHFYSSRNDWSRATTYVTAHVHQISTTTRRPVYTDGISFEQRLANALLLLKERNNRKEKKHQRERPQGFGKQSNSERNEENLLDAKQTGRQTNWPTKNRGFDTGLNLGNTGHKQKSVYEIEGSGSWDRLVAE
ncbi:hypothetical protein BIW11_09419 [Tropilaelaps mercedesae]|uniref:Uncharacterized protein n=1 Tax=Tropilaelaps mercedesae TaxID=418985 RepID=A0A1V9XK68_9ACAR|nr:hypothetical protein BIW11_09419 [Tropilaelaps mercedesae]